MTRFLSVTPVALLLAAAAPLCAAQSSVESPRWYVTGSLGSSFISDPGIRYTPAGGAPVDGQFKLGSGFMAGGTIGWYLRPDWRIEADYNYRTNTLRSASAPGLDAAQADSDFASVLIMANVLKDFDGWSTSVATIKPYVGAGLGIAQEVDTDLRVGGVQREFSGNRAAWQLLAGVNWQYRSPWFAGVGLRYVDAGALRLKSSPSGFGEIKADYKGLGLDVRLGYRF
jgi:opacity protein-like surface antigen